MMASSRLTDPSGLTSLILPLTVTESPLVCDLTYRGNFPRYLMYFLRTEVHRMSELISLAESNRKIALEEIFVSPTTKTALCSGLIPSRLLGIPVEVSELLGPESASKSSAFTALQQYFNSPFEHLKEEPGGDQWQRLPAGVFDDV
jgi:hypothetical protein